MMVVSGICPGLPVDACSSHLALWLPGWHLVDPRCILAPAVPYNAAVFQLSPSMVVRVTSPLPCVV